LVALNMAFDVDRDKAFDALTPNLRHRNHFLRRHTLEILSAFPVISYVTDHADLALTDDLDEEVSPRPELGAETSYVGPTGACEMIATLLAVERIQKTLDQERHVATQISRVEVMGRTPKLPVCYAEAAASHLHGLFHVKLAPMWPLAVNALVTLSHHHGPSVWLSSREVVTSLMGVTPVHEEGNEVSPSSSVTHDAFMNPVAYGRECVLWESSNGTESLLYADDMRLSRENGVVSRHQYTDSETVLESTWSVLENAPAIMTTNSKVIVPVFLRYMQLQYFSNSRDDPDVRELKLYDHIDINDHDR
jgi:hypothetical protein